MTVIIKPINFAQILHHIEVLSVGKNERVKTWIRTVLKNHIMGSDTYAVLGTTVYKSINSIDSNHTVKTLFKKVPDTVLSRAFNRFGPGALVSVEHKANVVEGRHRVKSEEFSLIRFKVENTEQLNMLTYNTTVRLIDINRAYDRDVIDYIEAAALPRDVTKLSYEQALVLSKRWHESMHVNPALIQARPYLSSMHALRAIGITDRDILRVAQYAASQVLSFARICETHKEEIKTGKKLSFGQRMQLAPGIWVLLDKTALSYEGLTMQHCVGGYESHIKSGRTYIFHIDTEASSYVTESSTLEITNGEVVQIKGIQNKDTQLDTYVVNVCKSYAETSMIKLGLSCEASGIELYGQQASRVIRSISGIDQTLREIHIDVRVAVKPTVNHINVLLNRA